MKSIIKYIIGGMGLLSITSCSDFLDQSSPSEIKGDMVFNSLTFTEQSLNKVYAGLTLDHTYGARIPLNFGFNTDIELVDADVNKPASFTESSERALGNYNGESISGSWSKLDDNWKNCFAIIEDANLVVLESCSKKEIRHATRWLISWVRHSPSVLWSISTL